MIVKENFVTPGAKGRAIYLDITYNDTARNAPLVIFAHGFKGFKDWGTHDLVARQFAENGFRFLKFNFSHNGTTPETLTEFTDLTAFSENTFSIELDDLKYVIDFAFSGSAFTPVQGVYLVGHSMGGGLSVIQAAEDSRVKKLVTMAAVATFRNLWPRQVEKQWKLQGVMHFPNYRTGQQMPVKSTLLDDLDKSPERLNIIMRATEITCPWLIAHGDADTTVPLSHAEELHAANPASELLVIRNGDHVFGGKHPYFEKSLPPDLLAFCNRAIGFLNN
ncbi:alpha/beta fold hydrolase [Mucilaginibacter limnophilus]|uniref:Alpha/beta fold hydrolase n=1 Tax=Mucilaginibacter limnophilus TaxID=1932778 RepID=A0A3S3TFR4_9SPHI|nr:alpha/beta fold hydrolase [Mucilaginibacter limnophilus]RVU00052.1 alpha/beta fold hydrolase [Mucilaginibacter limnophilus]